MPILKFEEALADAANILRLKGLETPRLDAEVILGFLLKVSRTDLYINHDSLLSADLLEEYLSLIKRRANREPVAYITGEREFMSLLFMVNNNVLIPRPETEIIVEEALKSKPLRIIDVGTGSGAIAVSMAYYIPESTVWAVDISPQALETARLNAICHHVNDRVNFIEGNLLDNFMIMDFSGTFDLITANLPYIPSGEMDNLPEDVRNYEPAKALDGGVDGLAYYRQLCPDAFKLLKPGGILLLEAGYDQTQDLKQLLEDLEYIDIKVIKDLAGLNRIVKAIKK